MDAIVESELLLEVERDVLAFVVLVPDDIVGTRHHAPGATRAQAGGDHFFVELFPLRRPTFADGGVGNGHGVKIAVGADGEIGGWVVLTARAAEKSVTDHFRHDVVVMSDLEFP
jgi:hypothetical protein